MSHQNWNHVSEIEYLDEDHIAMIPAVEDGDPENAANVLELTGLGDKEMNRCAAAVT